MRFDTEMQFHFDSWAYRTMSLPDVRVTLAEQESADSQRYLFCASPSSSSTPSPFSGATPRASPSSPDAPSDAYGFDVTPVSWTHVSDRWCSPQDEHADPGTEQIGSARPLSLQDHIYVNTDGCYWQHVLGKVDSHDNHVSQLRQALIKLRKWPDTAFCNCWEDIPDAHPYVSLIRSLQPEFQHPEAFHIFTDGSFHKSTGTGAWSFSIVLQLRELSFFRWGFTGGRIDSSCGSAVEAEALSTAHALVWLLSSLADTRYPIHLHGDATSVGFGADGRQNVPQLQSVERLHLRPLFQLCHAVVADLSFHHVPPHSGQLDNELVDSIAKALTFQQWSPFAGIPNIEDLLTMPLFDWAWLLIEKEVNYNKEYPSLDDLIEGSGYAALPSKPVAVFPQPPRFLMTLWNVTFLLGFSLPMLGRSKVSLLIQQCPTRLTFWRNNSLTAILTLLHCKRLEASRHLPLSKMVFFVLQLQHIQDKGG